MDDSILDRLFSGDLEKLIQLPKRVVRLFISSTFTDMTLERNSLMERVYPRLKKYCRERYGLDFQVVDMRWGVRDEATDDHQTVNLCSREISNCQRMSLGPNFVALLGDKYGFRPLCNRIKSSEYRALRRCLIELDINTDFLDAWYKEDLNAVPSEYILQPISSILKNFTNKNEPDLQAIDQRVWQAVQERLHELLMIGSSRLVKQGRLSEQEQLMKYSISVTEREVIEGCLDVKEAKSHCLVYVRSIEGLQDSAEKCIANLSFSTLSPAQGANGGSVERVQERKESKGRKASLKIGNDVISLTTSVAQTAAERRVEKTRKLIAKYIDLTSKENVWSIDDEAQKALADLKEVKLEQKLRANLRNLTNYKVAWSEQEGISLKSEEHTRYVNDLTEHFYTNLTRMIRKASKNEQSFKSGLIGEVLQHSHYAKHVSKTFHGRSEELDKIRAYICCSSLSGLMPMFVYGVGGSGKTSVLAEAGTLAKGWILRSKSPTGNTRNLEERWDQKPCIIMRFSGTTPNSSSIVGVLTSICRQLQFNFYQYGPLNGTNNLQQSRARLLDSDAAIDDEQQLAYQPIPEDFVRLVFTFRKLLDNCQHHYHKNRVFLIILDSVERLSAPAESSIDLKYSWLTSIVRLPPNVRLIVSCSSEKLVSGSLGEDYVHLKRFFLRSYFELKQSSAQDNEDDHKEPDAKNIRRSESEQSSAIDLRPARDGVRYHILKRLLVPAVRLMRGRTSSLDSRQRSTSVAVSFSQVNGWSLRSRREKHTSMLDLNKSLGEGLDLRETLSDNEASTNATAKRETTKRRGSTRKVWILHVRPMGVDLAMNVVKLWLDEINRDLSQQQWDIVRKSFVHCSRAIFVKLAFGEIVNWKSYSIQSDTKGLTFGSSLLKNKQKVLSKSNLDPSDPLYKLMKLANEQEASEETNSDEFKWHILTMEQQWLNYLDYRQREIHREEESEGGGEEKDGEESSVVIRVGTFGRSQSSSVSAASASICHLSNTIDDAICQLFARIELQHGFVLTKHSLSYITAARNGICENELEDILSLDDVVLDDVFQYHLPPVRRIPPLLWTRIRSDLPDYLSERDSDGIVINWHHSQFKQVTLNRYLCDAQQVFYIHSNLADYFLGKWADKAKPFKCTKQQILMAAEQFESAMQQSIRDSQSFGANNPTRPSIYSSTRLSNVRSGASFSVSHNRLRSSQHDQRLQLMQAKADRRVPHQPLFYTTNEESNNNDPESASRHESGSISRGLEEPQQRKKSRRYNLRKLTELPYHLIHSGRFLDLATNVLFNYKWLFAALDALNLQYLLADFNEASQSLEKAIAELASGSAEINNNHRPTIQEQELDIKISGIEEVDEESLRSMLNQLSILANTMRLSCSALHGDTQMLASQLIGRLLPLIQSAKDQADPSNDFKYLIQLLEQCDKDGCSDCALLPTDHCLQSPDGLQLSSLEGHSFAILSMCMAADQKHLLAVSNRFIMWDIKTGEVSRDVDPKIEGSMMQQLKMGSNNEYALVYTSNNLILVLDILTQQISKFSLHSLDSNQQEERLILGLNLIDRIGATRFVVWTRFKWYVLRVINRELDRLPSVATSQSERLSIELEYCVALGDMCIHLEDQRILSVEMVEGNNDDLAFVETVNGQSLELHMVEATKCDDDDWLFKPWKECVRAEVFALDSSLTQLVFADSNGDIYLRRRRCACWSKPKLISRNPRESADFDGASLIRQLNSFATSGDQVLIDGDTSFVPLAIELDFDRSIRRNSREISKVDELKLIELAKFERQIDAPDSNDVIEECCVFGVRQDGRLISTKRAKSRYKSATEPKTGTSMIKLYLNNKMVVIGLSDRFKSRQRNLLFPKNIRNISVEANRCQIKCVIVSGKQETGSLINYLVAAVGRRLLIYSIDDEHLLRCIDAHQARIVQLIPILSSENQSADLLSIASASLDKTVKIWNLSKVDKDIHLRDKLDYAIESICVSSRQPLAACLARGELGIWDWRTLKLVSSLSHSKLFHDVENREMSSIMAVKIVKCKFSSSGRLLFLASSSKIYLFAIDNYAGSNQDSPLLQPKRDGFKQLSSSLVFKKALPIEGSVRKLDFIMEDSRTLTMMLDFKQHSEFHNYSDSESCSDQQTQSSFRFRLTRRLLILCHSIPEGRLLFTIDCLTPVIQSASEAHYLSPMSNGSSSGNLLESTTSATERQSSGNVRLPTLTRDQSCIVCVEFEQGKTSIEPNGEPNERRKSSAAIKLPALLTVYSTRDGFISHSINLGQLDVYNSNPSKINKRKSSKSSSPSRGASGRQQQLVERAQQVSISLDQFTRLKPTLYLERQSAVALIDDDKGSSFIVDVASKQLLACSSLWNGKLSSDGRFGLSRMFKSSALSASSREQGSFLDSRLSSTSGLQLLEMRRCSAIKSLLTNENLNKLSNSELQTRGNDKDIICGFTKPNDAYVYFYDKRLQRLLLIRVSDSQLIANYKLSAAITKIKCSPDGYTLILALAEGSLTSLAIVDPQRTDTFARLAQYPSRKKVN